MALKEAEERCAGKGTSLGAQASASDEADIALLTLIRTVITAAVAKCPLTLIATLVSLQKANKTVIADAMSTAERGVQTFLQAAVKVLMDAQT